MAYKWDFPSANNTGTYGLRSYQEGFKDNPMLSLAKEICQNSLDAVDNENEPVRVQFNYFSVSTDKFPSKDQFVDILESAEYFCKKTYKKSDSQWFYMDAEDVLGNDDLICLRISDFNTKGLSGSDNEDNSDWTNLVKAVGVSDKGDGKGGSFGHGKFATFACSLLQTVFYSTNSKDGAHVSQGVARLSSFYNDNNEKTLGLGYYGNPKCSKMNEEFIFDPSFKRKPEQFGTDIYIMGFNDGIEDWKEKIIASVIDTFYVAIKEKKLIFEFGEIILNDETIQNYIDDEKIIPLLVEGVTKYNYHSYYDEDRVKFDGTIINENDVSFYLKVNGDPECLNRVSMVRMNGMKIYDQDRLPQAPFYGGTLVINNEKTDGFFRSLENPQHNGWSKERGKDPKVAAARITAIRKFIRDSIISFIEKTQPKSIDVGGLSEFLPDDADSTSMNDSETGESLEDAKNKKIEVKKVEMGKKNPKNEKKSEEEIIAEIVELTGEEEIIPIHKDPDPIPPHPFPNPLPPNPNEINKKFRPVKGINSNLYISNGYYNLSFKLGENAKSVKIDIKISGETMYSDDINIIDAKIPGFFNKKNLQYAKNEIIINNITNNEFNVQFKIDSDEYWPIEVSYYAVEK